MAIIIQTLKTITISLFIGVPTTPPNGYVLEDGTTFYVAEDGTTFYVQE